MRLATVVLGAAIAVVTLRGDQQTTTGRTWPPAVQAVAPSAPVLSPADALRTFSMPLGYRLELVASEPLIQDPILIDWDPAGRLWAVELPGYMRDIKAAGEYDPIGRIVVLEDSNGDGVMDRRTVFADGLIQPRAMKVLEQGVLVGEPPNVWLMRDTDGDLRSDRKELVAEGYGRRETNVEVNANALLLGLDNRIHMAGTGADLVLQFTGRAFYVQKSLSRGQWGATQDDAGRVFRNHNESVLHVDLVPTPYYARNPALLRTRGSHEALQDSAGNVNDVWPAHQTPGTNRAYQHGILREDGTLAAYTAACAPTVYRGDRLPAELYGNVFVAEPTANAVSRFVLSDNGRTLVARKAYRQAEFLTSTDERFRPVYLSNAPDGTLYIVDIYRGVIQHHAYITEYLRDQIASRALEQPIGLGRIYRIVHERPRDRTALTATPAAAQLVSLLSRPNGWWRDTAQRLLMERGDRSVAPALVTLAQTAPEWRTRVQALWTLDGLNAIEPQTVVKALADASREVRLNAVRVAERWLGETDHPVQRAVLLMTNDRDWEVRQQVAASLGALPAGLRERSLAAMLERHGLDPVMTDAALSGLRGVEPAVLAVLLASDGEPTPAREAAVTMVAATVVRAGQENAVLDLFAQAGESGRPAWQRAALLRGAEVALMGAPMPGSTAAARPASSTPAPCPTCPGGRAGPGGAYAFPRPADWPAPSPRSAPSLKLTREPAPLVKLATLAAGSDDLGTRAAELLKRISWPSKPGEAADSGELTAPQQQQFERGREVYRSVCQGCHQPDGRGLQRIAPSLIGSAFALAPADVPVRILLHGKEGSTGLMPPVGGALDDQQIADVLTYVRREWGQRAEPIDTAAVTAIRAASAGRTRPWTEAELTALGGGRGGPRE